MSQKLSLGLLCGLVLGVIGMVTAASKIEHQGGPAGGSLKQIAKMAYTWGYPLVVMNRSKHTFTQPGRTPLNRFHRFDEIVTPAFKDVVTPNVDTLYATAWLDLQKGPLILSVPATDGRYYVVQFLDAYTNVFKNIGKRTTGTEQGTYFITGPSWSGTVPTGMTQIKAPTTMVWLVARVLVQGQEDIPVVRSTLSKLTLKPLSSSGTPVHSPPPVGTPQDVEHAGVSFFDELGQALMSNPPPAEEKGLLELFAHLGIGPGQKPSQNETFQTRQLLAEAAGEAAQEVNNRLKELRGRTNNGWFYSMKTGAYGDDYLFRAVIAKQGFGANVAAESLYPIAFTDSSGTPLSGAHSYTVHFDTAPPVDGFWSLTMYGGTTKLLIPNPINRYALSDRSNLRYNKDGSLDIVVQHKQPKDTTNWLPAPTGPFYLVLRQYMPKQAILNDTYAYPTIRKA